MPMGELLAASSPATALLQTVGFPPRVLVVGAAVILSALISVAVLTVGYSIYRRWRRRRREPIRRALRSGLLDRLYGSEPPDWEAWVSSLSATEQSELESLLDVYLRQLAGEDAKTLAGLGEALGISSRSRRHLQTGDYWDRVHALTWLALLRDPPDRTLLLTHCTNTPRERALAARVLYLSRTDDCATTGVKLLLQDNTNSFSVFGIDTLYRVGEIDPEPLFAQATANNEQWKPALTQQVLLVSHHLNTVVGTANLDWIRQLLSNPSGRIRREAYHTLASYGWNQQLRAQIDLSALADDTAEVRASGYEMLGEWGDQSAIDSLCRLAVKEPNRRTRVAAANALYPHRHQIPPAVPRQLRTAWLWVAYHHYFDAVANEIAAHTASQP